MTKRQKELRHRLQVVSRVVMLIAFGLLVLFAITQTARMLSVVKIEHDHGVPRQWAYLLSDANPETITVPVAYYDQRSEPCGLPHAQRQFEYTRCQIYGSLAQGLVQTRLGVDGKPVSAFATAAQAAGQAPENRGLFGDGFRRFFNEVEGKSQRVDDTITFNRVGAGNTYTFGGPNFFPLNGNEFSQGDYSVNSNNYHFTAMTSFPFEVQLSGDERWEFRGDDDVWVFINNQLVLDIGGLHTAIDGWFVINADGSLTTNVDGKAGWLDLGLKQGDIAHLSFFYVERSTSDANCLITISNMVWPIRAEATITAETIDNQLIRYTSSITNRDSANQLDVTHIAAFLNEGSEFSEDGFGFLPLNSSNLLFTFTPDDLSSWRPINIHAPHSSDEGSRLATPIRLSPNGQAGDTAYFAFHVAPDRTEGTYYNTITYKTSLNGAESLARAADYSGFLDIVPIPPSEPGGDEDAGPPTDEDGTISIVTPPREPSDELGDPDDGYLDPLGEANELWPGDGASWHDGNWLAPGTGIADIASVILSQWFLLGTLLVFGASFAIYYPNRMY
ncbi:fibro-slime domain-containing protein [Candidatus Saccharibacteria bacterium]|nr:fibro-slime domain-containing protein [Candidatus Saccharibacteria bacterium]